MAKLTFYKKGTGTLGKHVDFHQGLETVCSDRENTHCLACYTRKFNSCLVVLEWKGMKLLTLPLHPNSLPGERSRVLLYLLVFNVILVWIRIFNLAVCVFDNIGIQAMKKKNGHQNMNQQPNSCHYLFAKSLLIKYMHVEYISNETDISWMVGWSFGVLSLKWIYVIMSDCLWRLGGFLVYCH